jgi:hypothetical protein
LAAYSEKTVLIRAVASEPSIVRTKESYAELACAWCFRHVDFAADSQAYSQEAKFLALGLFVNAACRTLSLIDSRPLVP